MAFITALLKSLVSASVIALVTTSVTAFVMASVMVVRFLGGLSYKLVELDHGIHVWDGGEDLEVCQMKTILGVFAELRML